MGDGPEAAPPGLVSLAPVASLRTFRTFRALRTIRALRTFTTVAPFTARGVLANARAFA